MERFFVRIAGQTIVSRQRAALHPEEAMRPYSLEELPKLPCSEWERSAVLDWAESAPVGSWLSWLNRQATEEVHGAVWFCLRRREPDDRPPVPDEVELLAAADRLEELGFDGAAVALRRLVRPAQRLYLLRPREGANGWDPWYDKCFGVVVRAANEKEARTLAAAEAGNEGQARWWDPQQTHCTEITGGNGRAGLILRDHRSA